MQDDYVKTFNKIRMDDKRKSDMRQTLEQTPAFNEQNAVTPKHTNKHAKTTRLSGGAKVGIVAAAVTLTAGTLMAIPTTRNKISASVKELFGIEIPEDAVDQHTKDAIDKEERVIPTDEVDESVAEEIMSAVSSQDAAEQEYFDNAVMSAEELADADLGELADYYEEQGYTLMDPKMCGDFSYIADTYTDYNSDWYSDGFSFVFWTGDNASGYDTYVYVLKASEDQLDNLMDNMLIVGNDWCEIHGDSQGRNSLAFNDFWSEESTDENGNIVYTCAWQGKEPELKLEPSDRACFINGALTYNPETQILIFSYSAGGGVG